MTEQVVDRGERQATRPGQRLCRRNTDEQCADKPGTARNRDELHVGELRLAFGERFADDGQHEL